MPNSWFRLYAEFAHDPKVQMMPEHMQRRLVMLFCERCNDETLHETERAFHWRITEEELSKTKALFVAKGFIEDDWTLVNWNRRQFLSDSSTERVRRYRSHLKQEETLHETERNVTETGESVSVTAPDTEQIQKQRKTTTLARSVPPEELAGKLPLVDGSTYAVSKSQVSEWSESYPALDVRTELKRFKSWLDANPTRRKTSKGICRAIVNWLSRAQDRSAGNGGRFGESNGNSTLEALRQSLAEDQDGFGASGDVPGSEAGRADHFSLLVAPRPRTV